jgi:hypothetical protein
VQRTFPKKRASMKGVEWGRLYNQYKDVALDPVKLEADVSRLVADEDVQRQGGIYSYLLTGDERHLNLRGFSANQKQRVYEKQGGLCAYCKQPFALAEMEGDHITPWHAGGKTAESNLQMLCKDDNRRKSGK